MVKILRGLNRKVRHCPKTASGNFHPKEDKDFKEKMKKFKENQKRDGY